MQAAPPELGPFFAHVKRQSHPSPKLLDLGIQMRWGAPRHSARLYRNLRDHAPYAFGFDDVVIHEEDAIEDFDYQPSYARRTAVGTFYPRLLSLWRYTSAEGPTATFSPPWRNWTACCLRNGR
jgi:hypothetical protein